MLHFHRSERPFEIGGRVALDVPRPDRVPEYARCELPAPLRVLGAPRLDLPEHSQQLWRLDLVDRPHTDLEAEISGEHTSLAERAFGEAPTVFLGRATEADPFVAYGLERAHRRRLLLSLALGAWIVAMVQRFKQVVTLLMRSSEPNGRIHAEG